MLGLRRWKCCATHGISSQGERPDLLFFTTRGRGELWPGAEADAASHATSAAVNPSATVNQRHAFAVTEPEAVTGQRE